MTELPSAPRLRYEPSLDGIRGIAVLAVLAFHAELPWAIGGFLGVDVFFVLSGFLITSLLYEEWARTGAIRLRAFYLRRAFRLFPALVALVIALHVYGHFAFVLPSQAEWLRAETLATLCYVANWAQAFRWVRPLGFLAHTWSLAIEEQFYLLWPMLLIAMLRGLGRRTMLAVVVTAALASAGWRAYLWTGPGSFARVCFGFDTHADGLLAGCATALALAGRTAPLAASTRRLLAAAATMAGLALLVAMTCVPLRTAALYHGGLALVAIATSLVVVATHVAPECALGRVLAWRPLVMVGWISYGLYLWHWPLFLVLRPEVTRLGMAPTTVVRFVATFAFATLSYGAVERVFLRWKERWSSR